MAALEDWSEHLRAGGRSVNTIKIRRYYVERAGRAIARCAGVGPWEVTGDLLTSWSASMDWKPETRRSARASLRGFYRWAHEAGRVEGDPTRLLPSVAVPPPAPRPVPDSVYVDLLASIAPRVRLMVRLGAEVGLRRAEISAVHADDVTPDLVGWSLRVRGKGGRTRHLPMPDPLARDVRAACDEGGGYAFPGQIAGHVSPDWVGRLIGRALPRGWSTHDLRHRFATRVYRGSSDLLAVQELLGHASPATTRRYVAVDDERLRRAVVGAL